MGDDAGNGKYTISLPDEAKLGELMQVILHGGCGNDWPIPYTGAHSDWVIDSNIGRLAEIFTNENGAWHIEYPRFHAGTGVKGLGVRWTFGDRPAGDGLTPRAAEPRMRQLYSLQTPAGRLVLCCDGEISRCTEESETREDGVRGRRLTVSIRETRERDVLLTAQIGGAQLRRVPGVLHTCALLTHANGQTFGLAAHDFSDASVRVPYKVTHITSHGFAVKLPQEHRQYARTPDAFFVTLRVAWADGEDRDAAVLRFLRGQKATPAAPPQHEEKDGGEVYRDERFALGRDEKGVFFRSGGASYELTCHPYEPCLYIKRNGVTFACIHNSFDPGDVLKAFGRGQTVTSVTGTVYDARAFCELLDFAAFNLEDADIGYAEGALAVERLKQMGAVSPQTAVSAAQLGLRSISERFSRSKKRSERVMYTDDGRVYVRIKE